MSCVVSSVHHHIFDSCYKQTLKYKGLSTVKDCKLQRHPDEDHQLNRINGWVLNECLDFPGKSNCTLNDEQKEQWKSTLQRIKNDKTDLPPELRYLDKGGLIFPASQMMPFMRKCDLVFKDCSSENNVSKYGKGIASVIKMQLKCDVELNNLFSACAGLESDSDMCNIIFTYWMEKYCNVRIKDTLLVSADKIEVEDSNRITNDSQNLRDGLKSDFVKSSTSKK